MKRLCAACMLWAMAVRPAATLHAAEVYNYWIEPCTADASARSGCNAADPELASWALEAWQKAGGSGLRFAPAGAENEARVRIYWLGRKPQLYGDAHVVFLNGKRVWEIEVQPDLAQFGPQIGAAGKKDRLFRDTVVYLTCLHGYHVQLPIRRRRARILQPLSPGVEGARRYSRAWRDFRGGPGAGDAPEHFLIQE